MLSKLSVLDLLSLLFAVGFYISYNEVLPVGSLTLWLAVGARALTQTLKP